MSFKVKMSEDHDVKIGRGILALKKGWSGVVVEEVFKAVIAKGSGVDASPKRGKKTKPQESIEE